MIMTNMDIKEVSDLITIRGYVSTAINNFSLDKETVRYMNDSLILIDKKIAGLLKSDEFKEYIDYKNVREAVQEVRRITDIKSSLKK